MFLQEAKAVPQSLSQQGRLLESNSAPVNGTHNLTFRIFESPSASDALWTESLSLYFDNGYYTATLGSNGNNLIPSALLSTPQLYLELQLNGDTPFLPRQMLNSAVYSRRAEIANSIDGGSVDASEILVGGTLVIDSSGA